MSWLDGKARITIATIVQAATLSLIITRFYYTEWKMLVGSHSCFNSGV